MSLGPSELSGQSELYFEGLVYAPQLQVTLLGGSSTYTRALPGADQASETALTKSPPRFLT
jgi:hypothetical protein